MQASVISRKQFLKLLAIASGTSLLPWSFVKLRNAQTAASSDHFRIRPVAGGVYASSFVKLCARARFKSFMHAVKCVRDRTIQFEVYRVSSSENLACYPARKRIEAAGRPEGNRPRATFFET